MNYILCQNPIFLSVLAKYSPMYLVLGQSHLLEYPAAQEFVTTAHEQTVSPGLWTNQRPVSRSRDHPLSARGRGVGPLSPTRVICPQLNCEAREERSLVTSERWTHKTLTVIREHQSHWQIPARIIRINIISEKFKKSRQILAVKMCCHWTLVTFER